MNAHQPSDPAPSRHPLALLSWAVYLGCSWTWLIGMLLPYYLARDFGAWSWLVFAVPNVLGAASVGWFFSRPKSSESFEARHPTLLRWFSIWTLIFHASVLSRLLAYYGNFFIGNNSLAALAQATLFLTLALFAVALSRLAKNGLFVAAWVTLLLSLGAFAANASMWPDQTRPPPIAGEFGPLDLAFAAPAIILGFLACPHLDLTIHRARRGIATPARSKLTFAVGFCVVFLAMITLTLLYAGGILRGITIDYLLIHFAFQSVFTCALHWRELRRRRSPGGPSIGWLALLVFGVASGTLAYFGESPINGKSWVLLAYETLVTPYALVFPAYLWTRVIVGEKLNILTRAQSKHVWWVSALIASPGFAYGYLWQEFIWLAAGVGVLLLLPLLIGLISGRAATVRERESPV